MIKKLTTLLQLLRNYFSLIKQYHRSVKVDDTKGKVVVFDLSVRRMEKYYYALIRSFSQSNYQVCLTNNPLFIGSLEQCGDELVKLRNIRIARLIPQPSHLTITDSKKSLITSTKICFIQTNVYSRTTKDNSDVPIPYPMSPFLYHEGLERELVSYWLGKRTVRIFFSGNLLRSAYSAPVMKNYFKVLNRVEIIDTLAGSLPAHRMAVLTHPGELDALTQEGYQNRFVYPDWSWSVEKSDNLPTRVANNNWLATLAKADFFVCCPGVVEPFCHNQTESMAVGCVPIIEFPILYDPPLRHLENCVAFSGSGDLLQKVEMVFNFSDETIAQLRRNVVAYYEANLSAAATCRRVEEAPNPRPNLLLHTDYCLEGIQRARPDLFVSV